jgi:hypothetical protein
VAKGKQHDVVRSLRDQLQPIHLFKERFHFVLSCREGLPLLARRSQPVSSVKSSVMSVQPWPTDRIQRWGWSRRARARQLF